MCWTARARRNNPVPAAKRCPVRPQSGVALVIVLWMLSLLIVLAMGYSRMVRTETGLTANLVRFNQARAMAEAGVWQAVSELLKPDSERQWRADGRPHSFRLGAGRVNVRIFDEGGKIDLNTAGPELLYGLLNAIELPEETGLGLLQAVLDWRDPDNEARKHGAEDADYQRLGYAYGAKDGAFNSVDELQRVMGFDYRIYRTLAPALTVYSRQPGINPGTAPRAALLALPNIRPAEVDAFIRAREQAGAALPPLPGVDSKYLSESARPVYSIMSEGTVGDSRAGVQVTLLMEYYFDRPYTILAWRESAGNPPAERS